MNQYFFPLVFLGFTITLLKNHPGIPELPFINPKEKKLLQNPAIKPSIKDYSEILYLVTSEDGLCLASTVSVSPPDSYVFLWYLQSNFKRNIWVTKH